MTAWLYQFVKGGEGELRYEIVTGLGRMDILLSYKGKKYIIETKVNRYDDISMILEEGIIQVSRKYLAIEGASERTLSSSIPGNRWVPLVNPSITGTATKK